MLGAGSGYDVVPERAWVEWEFSDRPFCCISFFALRAQYMSASPGRLNDGETLTSQPSIVRSLLSENERLQQALNAERQKSSLFENIFRCLPDAIAVAGPDRTLRMANPSFCDLFGYTSEEVNGKTTAMLYSNPEDFQKHGRDRFHLTAAEQLEPYNVEYKTKHDKLFTGETIGTPLRDDEGAVVGYLGLIRDVTERTRKANEILEREQLLRLITDALPELVTYVDRSATFRFANQTAERWYGCENSSIIGRNVYEVLEPQTIATVKPLMERAFNGETVRKRIVMRYPDRDQRTVEVSYIPHESPTGDAVGYVALAVDVTAQTRAEKELAISRQRLRDSIDAIPDAFAYYDKDDVLRVFNEQYRSLFTLSKDHIFEGAKFKDVLCAGVARGQYQAAVGKEEEWIAYRLAEHANPTGMIEQQLGDGRWIRIEERKTKDGGTVGVRIDVTDLKERERELEKLAVTDHLTGISNRRVFLAELQSAFDNVKKARGAYSVLLIDVDHFKSVNDTYGHAMGDEVLKRLSHLIQEELRPLDHVCRYGGEEFAVLLPNTSIGGAFSTAERIRQSVRRSKFTADKQSLEVSISIGATPLDERDQQYNEALARADKALYEAKQLGRDRVVVSPSRHEK